MEGVALCERRKVDKGDTDTLGAASSMEWERSEGGVSCLQGTLPHSSPDTLPAHPTTQIRALYPQALFSLPQSHAWVVVRQQESTTKKSNKQFRRPNSVLRVQLKLVQQTGLEFDGDSDCRKLKLHHPLRIMQLGSRRCVRMGIRLLSSVWEAPSIRAAVLESEVGSEVRVRGWVTAVRSFKGLKFLALTDGLSAKRLQVVLPKELKNHPAITHGAALTVQGAVVESPGAGQAIELQASHVQPHNLTRLGPIQPKTKYNTAFLRRYPHLRAKTNSFAALLRTRNAFLMSLHRFFQEREFINITTPALTLNDCEGGGETFAVNGGKQSCEPTVSEERAAEEEEEVMTAKEKEQAALEDASVAFDPNQFFGQPVSLATSGQLHLEAMAAALRRVYSISPAFRAEKSKRRMAMSEFLMLEVELAFVDELEPVLALVEDLIRQSACQMLEKCADDVAILDGYHHDGKKATLKVHTTIVTSTCIAFLNFRTSTTVYGNRFRAFASKRQRSFWSLPGVNSSSK